MDANEKAKAALTYINSIKFHSFTEFVEIASKDGKLKSIKNALGELNTYCLICEKLEIPVDPRIAESLNN